MEMIGGMRSRDYSLDRVGVDIEKARKGRAPGGGDDELARFGDRNEPALAAVMREERGAHRSGDVRAPLGPVRAAAKERAARTFQRREVDAQLGEQRVSRPQKAFGDRDAELAGEVVV